MSSVSLSNTEEMKMTTKNQSYVKPFFSWVKLYFSSSTGWHFSQLTTDNTDKASEWRSALWSKFQSLFLMFIKNVYSLLIKFTRQEQWLMITLKQQHLLLSHSRPTTANRKNLTATQSATEPHCYIVAMLLPAWFAFLVCVCVCAFLYWNKYISAVMHILMLKGLRECRKWCAERRSVSVIVLRSWEILSEFFFKQTKASDNSMNYNDFNVHRPTRIP